MAYQVGVLFQEYQVFLLFLGSQEAVVGQAGVGFQDLQVHQELVDNLVILDLVVSQEYQVIQVFQLFLELVLFQE